MQAITMERSSSTPQESRFSLSQNIHHYWGVVCLYCGAHVLLRSSANGSVDPDRSSGRVSLVWCRVCEREAPYRPEEIIDMHEEPTGVDLWGE
jgi:hypothetical protein